MKLIFKRIDTSQMNKSIEFLDVDHCIDSNFPGGFYTKNYIKPTALDRVFLNGRSYHSRNIFKSIIFSEATRLRRLNEDEDCYRKAIEDLKTKCMKSGFNKNLVRDMINISKEWKDRFRPPVQKFSDKQKQKTVWPTSFQKFLKLTTKERQ